MERREKILFAALGLAVLGWLAARTETGQGIIQSGITGASNVLNKLSSQAVELIKSFEGFSATPYPDAGGFSIGYGHFIQAGENLLGPLSFDGALELLKKDVAVAQNAIDRYVEVALSQNQYDALTSFVYNVGSGNFRSSTLLKLLNYGDYQGAADQLLRWQHAERRAQERDLFLS